MLKINRLICLTLAISTVFMLPLLASHGEETATEYITIALDYTDLCPSQQEDADLGDSKETTDDSATVSNDISVTIEGVEIIFPYQPPVIIDGRAFVPMHSVFEALGFDIWWYDDTLQATLANRYYVIIFTVGYEMFTVNGSYYVFGAPTQIINDSVMVPIRYLLERVGFFLGWDDETRTVIISSEPLPEPTRPIRRPMVALTFDDGPSAHTGRILDVLEYHDARATFFVIGRGLRARPEVALRAHQLGNEVANHLYHHQIMTVMNNADIIHDVRAGSTAIMAITDESPPIMRPPGGAFNDRVAQVVGEEGYALIMWSIDTNDWRDRNANTIYQRIMSNVRDGDIILLHDTHQTTAAAMERVIPRLIEEGFTLVTVSELLYYTYGDIEPGRVYFHAR